MVLKLDIKGKIDYNSDKNTRETYPYGEGLYLEMEGDTAIGLIQVQFYGDNCSRYSEMSFFPSFIPKLNEGDILEEFADLCKSSITNAVADSLIPSLSDIKQRIYDVDTKIDDTAQELCTDERLERIEDSINQINKFMSEAGQRGEGISERTHLEALRIVAGK